MSETATAITLRDEIVAEVEVAEVDAASDWVTVVQFFPMGTSQRDFSEALRLLVHQLGFPTAKRSVQAIPVLVASGDSGPQIHIARITGLDRGTFVGIHRLAELPKSWPPHARTMGQRSIISLAIRCTRIAVQTGDRSAIEQAIADELVAEITRVLEEQLDFAVALVASATLDSDQPPYERLASFNQLVEARLLMQRARTAARREGVEDLVVAQLDSVIDGLDSAASALAGVASTVLAETIARADATERARDRRITLMATSLLLPALLFALLGINWIPTKGLQEWWVFLLVLLVGGGLGVAGWMLGRLVFGRARPATAKHKLGSTRAR